MYGTYFHGYDTAVAVIERCRKNSEFRRAMDPPADPKDARQLNLLAYLVTPIQRLPRYELLLKDLLRHTWLEHPDKQTLQSALDSIRLSIVDLNESKKKDSTKKKVAQYQDKFRQPGELESLLGEGNFLCEATAKSYDESGKSSKVYLALFEDQLLVSKRSNDLIKDGILGYRKSQRYFDARGIFLAQMEQPAEAWDEAPDKSFGLKLVFKNKIIRLGLKDGIERNKWVRDINSARQKLKS